MGAKYNHIVDVLPIGLSSFSCDPGLDDVGGPGDAVCDPVVFAMVEIE